MYDAATSESEVTQRSHSLMDRMQVCGICDPGSIPGGSTKTRSPFGGFLFWCSHQLQLFEEKRSKNRSCCELV